MLKEGTKGSLYFTYENRIYFPRRRILIMSGVILTLVLLIILSVFVSTHAYLSSSSSLGQVTFSSSGQLDSLSRSGINDIIRIDLHGVGAPSKGRMLYAWLLPETGNDQIKPLLVGKASPTEGEWHLSYTSPTHANLLATFSRLRITEEDHSGNPMIPTINSRAWRYQGGIPDSQTGHQNGSFLAHLRHLLAVDPDLEHIGLAGGLEIWLYRNSQKILEYATAARDENDPALLRRHIIRILQYLDGNYYHQDLPPETPWFIDQKAGSIGLLDSVANQNPPGYLSHIQLHLAGLANAPGATITDQQQALKIDTALKNIAPLYQSIRANALRLVQMSNQDLLQPAAQILLNLIAHDANVIYVGPADSAQGISWIHRHLQLLVNFPVTLV